MTEQTQMLITRDGEIDWTHYEALEQQARAEALRALPMESLRLLGRGVVLAGHITAVVCRHVLELPDQNI